MTATESAAHVGGPLVSRRSVRSGADLRLLPAALCAWVVTASTLATPVRWRVGLAVLALLALAAFLPPLARARRPPSGWRAAACQTGPGLARVDGRAFHVGESSCGQRSYQDFRPKVVA